MSSLVDTPEYQAALRFVDLTVEKRALRDRMNEIDKQLATLEPALVGYLSATGVPQFSVKDYLLFPQREPWIYPAIGISRQMVCEALKISGLGRMVTENYSTQSLTRYVKDLEDHHKLITGLQPGVLEKLLPPALAHILNVKAAFRIRIKKKEPPPYAYQPEEPEEELGDEEQ